MIHTRAHIVLSILMFAIPQFTNLLSGLVGWRVLDYDVDRGSGADRFKYDMNHSGPLLALAFHW